jgi:hypothetical protein
VFVCVCLCHGVWLCDVVVSMSVPLTVGSTVTQDIQADILLGRMSQFMRHRAEAGQFSTERGAAEDHLHLQGVIALNIVSENAPPPPLPSEARKP